MTYYFRKYSREIGIENLTVWEFEVTKDVYETNKYPNLNLKSHTFKSLNDLKKFMNMNIAARTMKELDLIVVKNLTN